MDALEFNRSRKLNPDVVVEIQTTVGAKPDGIWGPRTVGKIIAWQKACGREADGKIDDPTLAVLKALWARDAELTGEEDLDDVVDDDAASDDAAVVVSGVALSDDGYARLEDLLESRVAALAAVQNDLFAFGFEPGLPDGQPGSRTRAAVVAFQTVARQSGRVVGDARKDVEITFTGVVNGQWDQATLLELARWKASGYRWVAPGSEYVERRVRVANYGRVKRSSVNLVEIPSNPPAPRKLHRRAAEGLERLIAAASAEAGLELRIQSGWRAHRWTSREHYEGVLRAKYGSVAKGSRYLAFDSPHETGLAVDFGTEGLWPVSSTIAKQRETNASKWLVGNAWRFGWCPYKNEPWHWEFPVSVRAWTGGDSDWG